MDDFERQMDNVRVQGACMDAALQTTVAATTPADQVDALLQQVADQHGLAIAQAMPPTALPSNQQSVAEDPLTERLAKLRG